MRLLPPDIDPDIDLASLDERVASPFLIRSESDGTFLRETVKDVEAYNRSHSEKMIVTKDKGDPSNDESIHSTSSQLSSAAPTAFPGSDQAIISRVPNNKSRFVINRCFCPFMAHFPAKQLPA